MPRARWAGGVAVAAALSAVGCLSLSNGPTAGNWFDKYGVFGGSAPPAHKVFLQTTLIDQPAGDPYLTHDLWAGAGKPVPPDRAALLAENGIRVGRIDGNPPPEFLKLVTSERHTVHPTQRTCSPGDTKVVPVNGPIPRTEFGVTTEIGAAPTPFNLSAAECGLAVTPAAAEDGRVLLAFEPRIQFGQKQGWLRLTTDGTGFAWRDAKPSEAFTRLGWEATLGPKDYLIIGPTEQPVGALGGTLFVNPEGGIGRMRVLVVRAWRGPDTEEVSRTSRRAVAAQASESVAARR
jgi:hypothetical protein